MEKKLSLSGGVILTDKLAQLAGVSVGDNFTIDGKTFKVGAITEHYVGHFVYMNQATYEEIYGQAPQDEHLSGPNLRIKVKGILKESQENLWTR